MTGAHRSIEELSALCESTIAGVTDLDSLESARSALLGKKGALTLALKNIAHLPAADRAQAGARLNELKKRFDAFYAHTHSSYEDAALAETLSRQAADVSLPGRPVLRGHLHPLSRIIFEIIDIFDSLGFVCADGPEMETDYHNFEALNFPPEHPARDMHDTFYVAARQAGSDLILRTHTSPVQIRMMQVHKPPLKLLIPGRVYRHEATDATHSFVFHQVEGLAVDTGISFADLKGTLSVFARRMFGDQTRTRFRPSFFPFTEPSAEMDISCIFCGGSGCRMCKQSGWLEIMGAGLVHPHVFQAVNYDPLAVQGFAFGMGVERIALLKYRISDMRLLYENDVRFLEQF